MAEAAVESNSRYFCHTCSIVISPVLPDFLCPTCQGGFVELLSPEDEGSLSSSTQTNTTERTPRRPIGREPDLFDMMQVFGDIIDQADSAVTPPNRPRDSTTNTQRGNGPPPNLRLHMPRTSITFQNIGNQPIALMDVFQSISQGGAGNFFLPLPLLNLHGNPQDYVWGEGGLDTIITQLLNNVEGQGPPPASKDDIDKLETTNITAEDIASGSNECPVCKDDFNVGDEVKKLPCEHVFHPDCVITWLKMHNTCPVCRRAIGDVPRQSSGTTGMFMDPTGMI